MYIAKRVDSAGTYYLDENHRQFRSDEGKFIPKEAKRFETAEAGEQAARVYSNVTFKILPVKVKKPKRVKSPEERNRELARNMKKLINLLT